MRGIFKGIWAAIVVLSGFVRDGIQFLRSCFSSRTSLVAENLFLRKRLSFYQEHQIRPRRLTNSARVALVFWSRFFEWRPSLLIVKPTTLIGWHRKAFSLFWKWKSRSGRPRLPKDLRRLIAEMVGDNPTWGQERIADELWLKLGIRVSPRSVRAYWPDDDPSTRLRAPSQTWNTFVRNHAQVLMACDFFVAGDGAVPHPLCIDRDGGRFPPHGLHRCDRTSHRRVDDSTTAGGNTQRPLVPVSHP